MRLKTTGHTIASLLSVLSVGFIAVGLVLGYSAGVTREQLMTRFSSAAESCPYAAVVKVDKDTEGNTFSVAEMGNLEVVNNRSQRVALNEGGFTKGSYVKDSITFDPTRKKQYAENDRASVTLKKVDGKIWAVKNIYCKQKPGSVRGCPSEADLAKYNAEMQKGMRSWFVFPEFRVNCNVNLEYGWVLSKRVTITHPTVTPRPTTTPRPTNTPRLTNTPVPTATPRVSVAPPIGGPANPTSAPTSAPIVNGRGSMEVQVVALNYPQRTPLWPLEHTVSHKPGSCVRQNPTEEARPLYLNSFQLRATCVSGGCRSGRQTTIDVAKNKGYGNFANLDPGSYKIEIRSLNKGYHIWPECNGVWIIKPNEVNITPVIILENELQGSYELKSTEKLCKDAKGIPHSIEGLGGNACYFATSTQKPLPVNPTAVPQPTQVPSQKCKAKDQACNDEYREKCFINGAEGSKLCHKFGTCSAEGDGTKCSWGSGSYCEACVRKNGPVPTTPIGGPANLKVNVRVDSDSIKKVTVRLDPCPNGSVCEQTASFTKKGTGQVQFSITQTDVRYRVKVSNRDIVYAQAIEGIRVKAERCDGVIERVDADYELCIVKTPSFAQFFVSEIKSQVPPPSPAPPVQPPRQTKCGYFLKPASGNKKDRCFIACPDDQFSRYCSPDYLRPYFGEFGEEVLRQAAGICWNESRGYIQAMNDRCFNTGINCSINGKGACWVHDFSPGLFQLNQIGVCVDTIKKENQTYGPSCVRRSGVDPYACIDQMGLRTFDGNVKAAKELYIRRNWQPWIYQCS